MNIRDELINAIYEQLNDINLTLLWIAAAATFCAVFLFILSLGVIAR